MGYSKRCRLDARFLTLGHAAVLPFHGLPPWMGGRQLQTKPSADADPPVRPPGAAPSASRPHQMPRLQQAHLLRGVRGRLRAPLPLARVTRKGSPQGTLPATSCLPGSRRGSSPEQRIGFSNALFSARGPPGNALEHPLTRSLGLAAAGCGSAAAQSSFMRSDRLRFLWVFPCDRAPNLALGNLGAASSRGPGHPAASNVLIGGSQAACSCDPRAGARGGALGLQSQVRRDLLDHRRLKDRCNELQLAAAVRAVLQQRMSLKGRKRIFGDLSGGRALLALQRCSADFEQPRRTLPAADAHGHHHVFGATAFAFDQRMAGQA